MCAKLNYHVCLAIFLSMIVIMQNTQEKVDLQKAKVNATKKKRFVQTEESEKNRLRYDWYENRLALYFKQRTLK